MKYLSLFSGIGGFELGIKNAYEKLYNSSDNTRKLQTEGKLSTKRKSIISKDSTSSDNEFQSNALLSCVGYSEIDKYAIQIYEKHFNHKNYGDIKKINPKELPDFDLVVGGFPCQSFSIAGKRGGFADTRGTLFFDIARIIREKQPRLLLLENVKGLLSHDKGRTFYTIISTLDELGYDCQWQVLNSKNFGVPQNRERVFIIGHIRGTSRPQVFPFAESNGTTVKKLGNKNPSGNGQSGQVVSTDGLHPTIGAGGGNPNRKRDIGWSSGYIHQLNNPKHSNDRIYGKDGLSPTLNTAQGGNRQPFIPEDSQIRRLTPTECERLQGFPDGWTARGIDENGNEVLISDTQRYKTLGNAITTCVVKEIMEKLK